MEEPTPSDPPTVSEGTAEPTAEPETLCGNGAVDGLLSFEGAEGVGQVLSGSAGLAQYVEVLYLDHDESVAESVRSQIEECIAAGPVRFDLSSGITNEFTWTTEGVEQEEGLLTARFSAVDPSPLNVDMLSVGHHDGVTMITYSNVKQLRTYLEPEEYAQVTSSAFSKLAD